MPDNIFSWGWKKIANNNDESDASGWTQANNESSDEFQKRILAEKAENDEHARKRTNAQLSDTSGDGLTQANLEQSKREGLISEEQYKKGLSDLRKKQWEKKTENWEMGNDGKMKEVSKYPEKTLPPSEPARPRKTKTEWKLIDGIMQEVEIEID
ncbi:hypothetical protein [Dolichospermum phage Dfl-JY23]